MLTARFCFSLVKRRFSLGRTTFEMAEHPIVTVHQGQLRGKSSTDDRGGQYFSFQGIPYAKPPLGELRFKAPRLPEPWSGVFDATHERSECYSRHIIYQTLVGSEDCLFLNVYTPQLPSTKSLLKPVMVWIHGGSFTTGSGNVELYSPDFLIQEDIVLVNINYRFGLLGFLQMEDPSLEVPGNAGLKDQVLALKWVQKNIASFGGDPNNVTIFGESAGGTSVHYLVLSPMAKGLFHRAIVQSGSALSCWAKGQPSAPLLAKTLGLNPANEKDVFKVLKEMPVEKLFEIQESLSDPFAVHLIRPIGPVVEKPSKEPAFISEEPLDLITSGRFNKVPLIIGFTSREGMLVEITTKMKYGKVQLVEDFEKAVPHMLNAPRGSDMSKKIAEKIKNFYYGEEEPSLENIDQFYQLQTDNFFVRAIIASTKLHANSSFPPVYLYRMSLESSLNVFKKFGQIHKTGVCHADDLGYLFKNALTPVIRPGSIEDYGVKRFTKLWATFARNGDPNPTTRDPLINITWKPSEQNQLNFLDIGENLTVGENPEAGRMAFWDTIFKSNPATSKL